MIGSNSGIYALETEWANLLRQRAIDAPVSHDLSNLLERYRRHGDFYRDRIAAADSWKQVPPLEKHELHNIPLDSATPTKEARTSGTSGFQVTIQNNRREREFRRALLYRPQLFYDLPQSVTQVVFVDGHWCADPQMNPKEFTYAGRHYRTWFAGASGEPSAASTVISAIWATLASLVMLVSVMKYAPPDRIRTCIA